LIFVLDENTILKLWKVNLHFFAAFAALQEIISCKDAENAKICQPLIEPKRPTSAQAILRIVA